MSTKETKSILKEVREDIKNENFGSAIEKCKKLLEIEKENYMAHLLIGAAYQNSDKTEAAKYLRKAVEYSPAEPTVALQGLANCASVEDLPQIYAQLLELVPEKYRDYYEKLYTCSKNADVALECFNVFKREADKVFNEERHRLLLIYLAKFWLTSDYELDEKDDQLFQNALEEMMQDKNLDEHLAANKRYLKLLFKKKNFAMCIRHAIQTIEQYPDDSYAYAWICKIYCENYNSNENVTWSSELKQPIDYYADKFLQLNENASLAFVIKAIGLYEKQQFSAARNYLYKANKLQENYEVSITLLARVEMELGAYGMAVSLCQQLEKLQHDYAICLSYSNEAKELNEAKCLLVGRAQESESTLYALARCYFKLNEVDKLNELPLNELARAEFLLAPKEAIELVVSSTELQTFAAQLLLGKLHLNTCNYGEALTCLLKATRLRPQYSECFFLLGKVYYATGDMMRTRKCLEKCISLNPICEEAVNNLSALYQQLGEEEVNVALLQNALKYMKTESSKRVHYRLGLHYLNINKWDDAIQSFRIAIKFDVLCLAYWESLGDAYNARGSYNSAIRVFRKILDMDESSVYAKLQLALIKTTVRMYSEAIEDFDILLKENPDYTPGLKGAAEAHLGMAYNLKLEHCLGRSKAHLQMAVNHLQKAFLTPDNHNTVWLWRLTANVFLQTAQMPNSMANLEVFGKLAKRENETTLLNRKDLLALCVRFCTCALKLKENTYLWYELAMCGYYSAQYIPEEAITHLDLAINACKMAITYQSDRWQNWNLLGVINMHKDLNNLPIAQHCLIQALTIDRKSYTTWTNLGVLYLKQNEIKLANQAFQRAQQSSPIYPNAWIGQAMIAEAINEEEEALDLFRHCQQFDFHPESALGYAHWVCDIVTNSKKCTQPHYKHAIENMYADIVGLDAINWYIAAEEDNASVSALSFQGFLNVRQKLYRSALKSYVQAAQKASLGAERDKILTNQGYLHLKLNEPNEAINAFNMVTQTNFEPIMGLATAYFRSGQHQEAYSVYNSVLGTVAGIEDNKAAHILVVMAAMVYAFQGEADTKTILYQCLLLKNPPIQAIYSACALGILHNDNQLMVTMLGELAKHENNKEHCADIAFLTAQFYLFHNEPRKALNYILCRVHTLPHCAKLRKLLANFMLDHLGHKKQYQIATSQIALSAVLLAHSNKNQKSDCVEDSETYLVASRALRLTDKTRAHKLIQRAIHLYPKNENAWSALNQVH